MIEELVSHGTAQLALEALDDPAVNALAEAVAGAPPGTALSGQLSWAAGNPLFVIGLIKALREQGSLQVDQGRADVANLSLPQTLPLTILRRVSFLPPATLEVLRVAAVLGREFRWPDCPWSLAAAQSRCCLNSMMRYARACWQSPRRVWPSVMSSCGR